MATRDLDPTILALRATGTVYMRLDLEVQDTNTAHIICPSKVSSHSDVQLFMAQCSTVNTLGHLS